jgi:hypothetical protein
MIQMLFPNNTVFQVHSPVTAEIVQSWFEEHEDELQHISCPVQSAHLYVIKPLWSVLETGVRDMIPTSNMSKAT